MGGKPADIWYSARLAEPFAALLPPEVGPPAARGAASRTNAERWLRATPAHRSLQEAVARTGDPTLGLKAGRTREPSEVGALGYAIHTAATVHAALEVAARYIHVLNHALDIRLETKGARARLCLDSRVALPAVAEDFMLSAFYSAHLARLLPDPSAVSCYFLHDEPKQWREYQRSFGTAQLQFSAAFSGFVFPRAWLRRSVATADPRLHAILIDYLERSLNDGAGAPTFTAKVRDLIGKRLAKGKLSSAEIAAALKVSERTLARRLASEGTSFLAVLEEVRRARAVEYLHDTRIAIDEIAFLLGFSQTTAFYRAFKRWTGKTPQQYRRSEISGSGRNESS